jgi:hypothetical protein
MYDRVVVVLLDEGSYDAKGGETKVFKGTRFGSRIQERIKKERYMRVQEELSCLRVRCDALKKSESIANAVRYMCCKIWRGEHRIDRHNLLEESRHDP